MPKDATSKPIRINSVFLDELIVDSYNPNYSKAVNEAVRDAVNQNIWLHNLRLHEYAQLEPDEFYKRLNGAKYLKSSFGEDDMCFTFYPSNPDAMSRNKAIWEYVNGNYNAIHTNVVIVSVRLPQSLFHFLYTRTWEQVERAILGFLTVCYWKDSLNGRERMELNLGAEWMDRIDELGKSLNLNSIRKFKPRSAARKNNSLNTESEAELARKYISILSSLGIDPIIYPYMGEILDFVKYPFDYGEHIRFNKGFDVRFSCIYIKNVRKIDEWQSCILAESGDESTDMSSGTKEMYFFLGAYSEFFELED